MRYLQTLLELSSPQSTTIVFPDDLISPFLEKATATAERRASPRS